MLFYLYQGKTLNFVFFSTGNIIEKEITSAHLKLSEPTNTYHFPRKTGYWLGVCHAWFHS